MKQFIIKLPEGTKLDLLDEETQAAVKSFKGQFPSGLLVGSQAVGGYELKLIMADIDATVFEEQISAIGLDWAVVASEGVTIDQSLILPYMLDTPTFDDAVVAKVSGRHIINAGVVLAELTNNSNSS